MIRVIVMVSANYFSLSATTVYGTFCTSLNAHKFCQDIYERCYCSWAKTTNTSINNAWIREILNVNAEFLNN